MHGFNVDDEDFIKDYAYTIESLKSCLLRNVGVTHPIQDTVEKQLNLETSNLQGIRTYAESLSDAFSYVQFAEDTELKNLLVNTKKWPKAHLLCTNLIFGFVFK